MILSLLLALLAPLPVSAATQASAPKGYAPVAPISGVSQGLGVLVAMPHQQRAGIGTLSKWFEDPGKGDAAFRGLDPVLLDEFLHHYGVHGALKRELRALGGGADVPERLLANPDFHRIRMALIHDRRTRYERTIEETFPSLAELERTYRRLKVAPETVEELLDGARTRPDGFVVVPHSYHTWGLLTPAQQASARSRLRRYDGERLRLRLSAKDDLAAVARRYALGRDPKPIENMLRRELELRGGRRLSIPLERLLPKFITTHVRRFEDCTGANCLGATISTFAQRVRYATPDVINRMLRRHFRQTGETIPFEPGTVLVYRRTDRLAAHSAVSVGDGFVFTKNGLSRDRPYMFMRLEDMEAQYPLQRETYRLAGEGDGTNSRVGRSR